MSFQDEIHPFVSETKTGAVQNVGQPQCGRFRILREIARGSQGVVYQALQDQTNRKVALKVLQGGRIADQQSRLRFEREISLVAVLSHPGIVPIFESGTADGNCYYAMAYIRGAHLNDYVRQTNLSVRETLALFVKVCEAVGYAHQNGVIHRDLKPSNILVDERGQPHVLDFGLAKVAGSAVQPERVVFVSETGQMIGTPAYMSPEQAVGKGGEVDLRSDVYALGVMLYEALAGELPYPVPHVVDMKELAKLIENIVQTPPRSLRGARRGIDDEVQTVVEKALSKEKQRRYVTAGAMAEDLQRHLDGEPIEAKRASMGYLLAKSMQRYRWVTRVAVGYVALISIAAVVVGQLWRKSENGRLDAIHSRTTAEEALANEELANQQLSDAKHRLESVNQQLEDVNQKLDEQRAAAVQSYMALLTALGAKVPSSEDLLKSSEKLGPDVQAQVREAIKSLAENAEESGQQVIRPGLMVLQLGVDFNLQPIIDSADDKEFQMLMETLCAMDQPIDRKVIQASLDKLKPDKARSALVGIAFDEYNSVPAATRPGPSPAERIEFIDNFSVELLHAKHQAICAFLRDSTDHEAVSAILLGISRHDPTELREEVVDQVVDAMSELAKATPSGIVRSALLWTLGQWGRSIPDANPSKESDWFINAVGALMLRLPAGKIRMGIRETPPFSCGIDEVAPTRTVRVGEVQMAAHEVTIGQFRRFLDDPDYLAAEKPSGEIETWRPGVDQTMAHPVGGVSWYDAILYCNWLSRLEERRPCYIRTGHWQTVATPYGPQRWERIDLDSRADGYRLPTSAEWECACRAGTTTFYYFGDRPARLAEFAVINAFQAEQVGTTMPNGWGFYNMLANLTEWCWDPVPPLETSDRSGRIIRGACYFMDKATARRRALSGFEAPHDLLLSQDRAIGFRVVCQSRMH